jgi:hypothetical protein
MANDAVDDLSESIPEENKLSFAYEPAFDALHVGNIHAACQIGLGCIPYPEASEDRARHGNELGSSTCPWDTETADTTAVNRDEGS